MATCIIFCFKHVIIFFSYEKVTDMPCMSYGLAHEFGAVWDMAWCPSGAYESKLKIGLLALSTSCGDCPVFAMPPVNKTSEMYCLKFKKIECYLMK